VSGINVDLTGPSITATVSPARPASGWWNIASGAPTVSFVCSDGGSGLAGTCPDPYTFGGGEDLSYSQTIYDNAGNSATAGVSNIDVDLTAPSITATVSPARPASGWWNIASGAPTVSFVCSDGGSGLAGTCPDPYTFGEGENQSYSQTVYDNAGNSASNGTSDIDVDLTAPSITAIVSPARPASGWWNIASGAPTVTYTCGDGTSGVKSCTMRYTFVEGADQSHTGYAEDNTGNTNSASVSDIDVDLTAPTLTWSSVLPADGGVYYYMFVPAEPTCNAVDTLSGPNGCAVTGYGTGLGSHTITATALDVAGNSYSESRTYTVNKWTMNGFFQPVDMGNVWNTVKKGSTVPLKWRIFAGTTELKDISYIRSVMSISVACTAFGTEDAVEEIVTTGGTVLRYDTVGGQFIDNWKVPSTVGCYRVVMTALDGSQIAAYFKIK
jgi:hypothetical protein